MQVFCVAMMIIAALITLTGRGVLSILLGTFGFVFAVEGLTGYITYNVDVIRNFTSLLVVYCVATIIIGVLNLVTIPRYCAETAGDERSRCENNAAASAYGLLAGASLGIIVFILASRRWIRLTGEVDVRERAPGESDARRFPPVERESSWWERSAELTRKLSFVDEQRIRQQVVHHQRYDQKRRVDSRTSRRFRPHPRPKLERSPPQTSLVRRVSKLYNTEAAVQEDAHFSKRTHKYQPDERFVGRGYGRL